MSIEIQCQECFQVLKVPDKFAGKSGRCKHCGAVIEVPEEGTEDAADEFEIKEQEEAAEQWPAPPIRKKKRVGSSGGSSSLWSRSGVVVSAVLVLLFALKTAVRIGGFVGRGFGKAANAVAQPAPDGAGGGTPALPLSAAQQEATRNPLALFPLETVNLETPAFTDDAFQRIDIPNGQIFRLKQPIRTVRPGYMGDAMQLQVYLPQGEHARGTLPCVLVPPAGTPLISGSPIDTGLGNPEHLPYVNAGFAVVTFSLDGWLTSDKPGNVEVQNAYRNFASSFAGLVNARIAMKFVREQLPAVDASRIFIAGHSSAGTLALLFAAHEPALAGCIAYAPQVDVEGHISSMLPQQEQRALLPGVIEFAQKSSPRTHVGRIQCPTFLFHASNDAVTSAAATRSFADVLRRTNSNVEYREVPGVDHYETMVHTGVPAGLAWMQARLGLAANVARSPLPQAQGESDSSARPSSGSAGQPPGGPAATANPLSDPVARKSGASRSDGSARRPARRTEAGRSGQKRDDPPPGARQIEPQDKLESGARVLAINVVNWEAAEVIEVLSGDRVKVHFLRLPAAFDRELEFAQLAIPLPEDQIDPTLIVQLKFELVRSPQNNSIDMKLTEKEFQALEGYLPESVACDRTSRQISLRVIRGSFADKFSRVALANAKILAGRQLSP